MTLKELGAKINATAVAHGWWELDRNLGEMFLLAVSEICEAHEEWRKDTPSPVYFKGITPGSSHSVPSDFATALEAAKDGNKPEGQGIEVADCIIRLLDTAHFFGWDMDELIAIKMAYNNTRPYRHGGLKA